MDYLLIASVYAMLETFFLISLRLIGFFAVVPIFGGQGTNVIVRIVISMTTAFIIMTSHNIAPVSTGNMSIFEFFAIGIKEIAIGLIMGFIIYLLLATFYYVGQLVDHQIGFAMVSVYDPISQMQIPITGNLFYLTVSYLLILTGAHYNFFRALFYSYQVLPIGEGILVNQQLFHIFVGLFGTFLLLGFKTALPVIGTMLVIEAALGMLNRAAPQMHIFSVGMSIKILMGLAIIYVLIPVFGSIAETIFNELNRALFNVIGGMMP